MRTGGTPISGNFHITVVILLVSLPLVRTFPLVHVSSHVGLFNSPIPVCKITSLFCTSAHMVGTTKILSVFIFCYPILDEIHIGVSKNWVCTLKSENYVKLSSQLFSTIKCGTWSCNFQANPKLDGVSLFTINYQCFPVKLQCIHSG